MNKNFFKDKGLYIFIYSLNSFFIISYFNLVKLKSEILYPSIISIFLLSIIILIEWFSYSKFNSSLDCMLKDKNYKINAVTNQQKKISEVLGSINKKSILELNKLKSEYEWKSNFIAKWIHELKTPISVIDLIIREKGGQHLTDNEFLKEIQSENNRLYLSVEQVLSIIRLNHFQKDYEVKKIDLIENLRKAINDKKEQFIYNKIFPVINSKHDQVEVLSDSKWNKVILEQVISNAIKYSACKNTYKKVYFSITIEQKYAFLSIKDEGIGIPKYDLKRVFEPFFTGENGREIRSSTGIGLYICKEIADKLGHKIEIKSEVKKGTEIIIRYLSKT